MNTYRIAMAIEHIINCTVHHNLFCTVNSIKLNLKIKETNTVQRDY